MKIQNACDGPGHYVALLKLLILGVYGRADEAMCFDLHADYSELSDLDLGPHLREYSNAIPECDREAAQEAVVRPLRRWAFALAGQALQGSFRGQTCSDLTGVLSTLPRSVTAAFGLAAAMAAESSRSDGRADVRTDGLQRILFVHEQDHIRDDTFALRLCAFPIHEDLRRMTHEDAVLFLDSCDGSIEENYALTEEVAGGLAPVRLFYDPEKHKEIAYHGFHNSYTLTRDGE